MSFTLLVLEAMTYVLHGGHSTSFHGRDTRVTSPSCCICINCRLVDRCKTYHWVETMHQQPHVTLEPNFEPNDPQIQVFIRNETSSVGGNPKSAGSGESDSEATPMTIEYDVFACDAFTEDKGRWIRLMPDADFIPT